MKTKSASPKLLALIAVLAVVVALACAIWFFAANVIVGGAVYPRNAEFLNLRDKDLTIEEYEAIRAKLPNCQLYWSVPFQGKAYPENTTQLKVSSLSEADAAVLAYFPRLETLDAVGCTDYAQLAALRANRPELAVLYNVTINGTTYAQDARAVTLTAITDEEMALLQYLPELETVDAKACTDYARLAKLGETYPQLALDYAIVVCGEEFATDSAELTLTALTEADAALLKHFHSLTKVHLVEPELAASSLVALPDAYADVTFTWEKTVMGVTIRSDSTEVDLSNGISEQGMKAFEHAKTDPVSGRRDDVVWQFALDSRYVIPNREAETQQIISQVEEALAYFPNVEQVTMNGAYLDNEMMAKFREDHRQDYKVVWTVALGTMAARTDTPYFMPYKYGVAYFFDDYAYNLRYCEDIICIDLGHMSVHVADFVEFMPNLKYLILAHTQVKDITPLQHCKSLVFLELDWSIVRDYTPLLGCTALEDLNVSKTYADVTPLLEMTWLNRLWITDRSPDVQYKIAQNFEGTKTQLYLNGFYTVGGGWRETENYYAMRDVLGMGYMK